MEICFKDFEEDYVCIFIKKFDFVVFYREIVLEEFDITCLFKFLNKYNRLFMKVRFMVDGFFEVIDNVCFIFL